MYWSRGASLDCSGIRGTRDAAMAALPARAGEKDLMALSKTLKGVTTLYQTEVAAALDVPLGFSDADGD